LRKVSASYAWSIGNRIPGLISGLQGLLYVATGIWPVAHMRSFLAVTGPKTDLWLVQAFGILVCAIGLVLLVLPLLGRLDRNAALFGFACALALAVVDFHFVLNGSISRVYLVDGVIEATLATLWLIVSLASYRTVRPPRVT